MIRPGREHLTGEVEVDEFFLGGMEEGGTARGRRNRKKVLVATAVEKTDSRFGRIRLRRIRRASREVLHGFVTDNVEPGTVITTDGWQAYYGLEDYGFKHEITVLHGRARGDAHVLLPYVHRVAGLFKRWWLCTHQGAIRAQHLDYYLDEFTFRFNRRTSRSRGLLFYRLVQQALVTDQTPYKAIVGGTPLVRLKPGEKSKERTPHKKRRKPPASVNRPAPQDIVAG